MADQESSLWVRENADVARRLIVVDSDTSVAGLLAKAEADSRRAVLPTLWCGSDEPPEPPERHHLVEFFAYETMGMAMLDTSCRPDKNGHTQPSLLDADFT